MNADHNIYSHILGLKIQQKLYCLELNSLF